MSQRRVRIALRAGIVGNLEHSPHYPEFSDDFASFLRENDVEVTASPDIDRASAVPKDPSWVLPIIEMVATVPLGVLTSVIADYVTARKAIRHEQVKMQIIKFDERTGQQAAVLRLEGSANDVAGLLKEIDGASHE